MKASNKTPKKTFIRLLLGGLCVSLGWFPGENLKLFRLVLLEISEYGEDDQYEIGYVTILDVSIARFGFEITWSPSPLSIE